MLQIIPSFLYIFKNFPCLLFCGRVVKWVKESKNMKGLVAKPEVDQNHFGKYLKKFQTLNMPRG